MLLPIDSERDTGSRQRLRWWHARLREWSDAAVTLSCRVFLRKRRDWMASVESISEHTLHFRI